MNDLINLEFEAQQVRIIMLTDEPWFIAADVAEILGYDHTPSMVRLLDEDEAAVHNLHSSGQARELSIISESGLYNAIFRSRRPEAKAFRKWVTGTVLPTLRRTGRYALSDAPEGAAPLLDVARINAALGVVREARRLFGDYAARGMWADLGLPMPGDNPLRLPDTGRAEDMIEPHIVEWIRDHNMFTTREIMEHLGIEERLRMTVCRILRRLAWDQKKVRRRGIRGEFLVWLSPAIEGEVK